MLYVCVCVCVCLSFDFNAKIATRIETPKLRRKLTLVMFRTEEGGDPCSMVSVSSVLEAQSRTQRLCVCVCVCEHIICGTISGTTLKNVNRV